MIKLENVVLASPEQMEFIIQGMRNPMNSWEKSDSNYKNIKLDMLSSSIADLALSCAKPDELEKAIVNSISAINDLKQFEDHDYIIGPNDILLMQRLSKAGTDHRKFMRMMPVYVRITAPLYWWKEFGTVANSYSTMHKIAEKEFTMEDFSCEHISIRQSMDVLKDTIDALNVFRDVYLNGGILRYENGNLKCFGKKDKEIWWQMIQLLPSSYNQTRNVMMNYEVLANIYRQRKNHKLDEWRKFCNWIKTLPYQKLITGEEVTMCDGCKKQYEECRCDCTREYEKVEE